MEKELFKELISSIREAGRISRGEAQPGRAHASKSARREELKKKFKPAQLVRLRNKLHLSQSELADLMLISKATLQSWEQGRRTPEGPALALIEIMRTSPESAVVALH